MAVLLLIYDFLFLLGLSIYIPQHLWRKKMSFGSLKAKFGFIGFATRGESIWIQAVSVGEVNVIARLIQHLKENYNYEIVISTTTLLGNTLAREKYSDIARIIYLPFDISFVVRRVIRLLKPKVFIAVETEIWPNLFYYLKHQQVPILVINARISEGAFKHYRLIRPIMQRVLALPSYVGVQNQEYKERFMSLGLPEDKIAVSGQMKFETSAFDNARLYRCSEKYSSLLVDKERLLIVAGSTHPGEEEMLLNVYSKFASRNSNVRLGIAPRHIERVLEIERIVKNHGFLPVRLSSLRQAQTAPKTVFIFDTIGELPYFYSIADICFVGGSLMPHGGHNILEPIYFSKPTLFGPHMENFKDIEEVVLRYSAGIKVTDALELETQLRRLIDDSAYRSLISGHCQRVFQEERKGLEEHIELITQFLQKKS